MAKASEILRQIAEGKASAEQWCFLGLTQNQRDQVARAGFNSYQGKVRELVRQGDRLWVYHSDRLSAFDRFVGEVPLKGAILAAITEYWLKLSEQVLPSCLQDMPHYRVLRYDALEPLKVEVVVRGYMAGSMARAYADGQREFCGNRLPEGLVEFGKLPAPIITPTTKAEVFEHDEETTPADLVASGVVSQEQWDTIATKALALFELGSQVYAQKGWVLVDTKYEFGLDKNGAIVVMDEVHTPDSSRLWRRDGLKQRLAVGEAPEMLDKEVVRRYLMERGFKGEGEVPDVPMSVLVDLAQVYLEVAESLLGRQVEISNNGPLPLPQ